ncbi:protein FAR1-RELATED SEQUENCE 7-like [Spinacia oleracea]|uniref:Protein FAR1-RELATED SEQUENCE 7-like n=1 Tax=Spinacia oleracea TaxID=3562 RepID=A0A9R0J0R2_SPIOL|nr:protein FAR1-RELATED SEQUENCE 7-like [Spinacia oleracea]
MDSSLANESSDNIVISDNWVPRVGMEFDSMDHAWNFWLEYGGKMGFNVRKHYENKNKNGQVTSRRFLCSKESFRLSDKRDHLTTNPRAETRTGCMVRIGIIIIKPTGKYRVHEFVSEHNHVLHCPGTSYLLSSQRKITEVQAVEIKLADDYGIRPRAAHEFIGAHVGGSNNLVSFDTTFGTNKEHRPLGVFVGFNHFRETTVFGAILLYDETTESFKWLFETFLATHGNKHPKTIFTDQDIAMGKAIAEVMPKHQLSESFNKDLKGYLKCALDIMRFFKQFERVVGIKRQNETNNEFDSREKLPRIKMRRSPLLRQVGQIYTPNIFEAFQDEYDWSMAAYIKQPVEGQLRNEYRVAISDLETDNSIDKEYQVLSDPLTETISCSCKIFERLGILCAHALKVLDTMNIKLVPAKYILKRWTREARAETVQDISGRII